MAGMRNPLAVTWRRLFGRREPKLEYRSPTLPRLKPTPKRRKTDKWPRE